MPVGTVLFTLINDGTAPHNFSIAGTTSPIIEPGATQTMTVSITQAGDYAYSCSLPAHAAFGMSGTLSVTGGKPAPTKPTATIKVSETEFEITLKTTAGKPVKSVSTA